MTTDVLIIGAGPTGLMLANQLNRFGIDFLIVDQKDGPTNQSRALVVTPRSMEVYQQLNLSDQILEQANFLKGLSLYSEGKLKAEIQLSEAGKGLTDFINPMFIFEQSKNEELLNIHLSTSGKNVLWNYEFISLKESAEDIDVVLRNIQTSETIQIKAKYIVGCDGAKSPVRHQRDFKFEGGTYENKFYVVDTTINWKFGKDKLIMVPSDEVFVAFFPMKGEKQYRIIGTLPKAISDNEEINFDALETTIKKVTKFQFTFEKVGWHSIYRLHHRCVDTFSKGRIFLAGDAAHIHSPAGGQGMNTGLQDAHNLSWKLAFVVKGIAKVNLLDTYNEERLPFAHFLLNFTDQAFRFMAGGSWFVRNFRKYILLAVIERFAKLDRIKTLAFKNISQLFYSYYNSSLSKTNTAQKLKFKAGDKLPFIANKYLNLFQDPVFHLLRVSNTNISTLKINEINSNFPFAVKLVKSKISEPWIRLGVTKDLFILIRPDQYILYITDVLNKSEIIEYLGKYFNIK